MNYRTTPPKIERHLVEIDHDRADGQTAVCMNAKCGWRFRSDDPVEKRVQAWRHLEDVMTRD